MSIFTKIGGSIAKLITGKGLVNVDFDQIQDKEAERRLALAGLVAAIGVAVFLVLLGIGITGFLFSC